MSTRKKAMIGAAAALAVAAGGVGVAQAVGGDDEDATGPSADRAKAAGVRAAGGGSAVGVERSDERKDGWEVEVRKADGSTLEVQLDASFRKISAEPDDDSREGSDDD